MLFLVILGNMNLLVLLHRDVFVSIVEEYTERTTDIREVVLMWICVDHGIEECEDCKRVAFREAMQDMAAFTGGCCQKCGRLTRRRDNARWDCGCKEKEPLPGNKEG